jgi:hypothetical protein
LIRADTHPGKIGNTGEVKIGEVVPVFEAVEGCIEVGSGVGDHLDGPDVELGARAVVVS